MGRSSVSWLFQSLILTGFYYPLAVFAEPLTLTVCYNFGCKSQGVVQPDAAEIKLLGDLFNDVGSALDERARIRLAIAHLEQMTARYLPTGNDVGGNYTVGMIEEGKQDCIDESLNTTTYLQFLAQQGWLRWHTVEERVHRAPAIFDGHWAAQIRVRDSGQRFVVDSWHYDNGEPPLVQPLERWLRKQDIND